MFAAALFMRHFSISFPDFPKNILGKFPFVKSHASLIVVNDSITVTHSLSLGVADKAMHLCGRESPVD